MGVILVSYFDKAKQIGGLSFQVKLAVITKMSSSQAMEASDSPENIAVFEAALNKLAAMQK